MEATTLCFRLLMLEFLLEIHIQSSYTLKSGAVLLRVDPNRLQHFDYESLTFHCEGTKGSIKLRGSRNAEEYLLVCEIIETSSSSCTISKMYHTDSGEYWCESGAGERSNKVNLTITAGSVILDSPAFPVFEGDNVTLHCQTRKTSMNQTAHFYKDGVLIEGSPSEQMTVYNISKSDEGFFKCSIDGVGESPESFLAVGEMPSDQPESRLCLILKLGPLMVFLLVTFIYCRKRRASSETPTATSNSDEAAAGDEKTQI